MKLDNYHRIIDNTPDWVQKCVIDYLDYLDKEHHFKFVDQKEWCEVVEIEAKDFDGL